MRKYRRTRYTVAQVEEALRLSAGVYTIAAQKLGCSRKTISAHVQRSKKLQAALEDIVESTLDHSEAQLLKKIRDGNLTATIFYLKCKGKHRGYIETAANVQVQVAQQTALVIPTALQVGNLPEALAAELEELRLLTQQLAVSDKAVVDVKEAPPKPVDAPSE